MGGSKRRGFELFDLRSITAAVVLLWCHPAPGDVTLDGSLGPAGPLPGPDYQVSADLGQQQGGNLFHSFGRFRIESQESVTFQNPASVDNIVGRVTGGDVSDVDGTLRTEGPGGANLWLINPAGIVFGENASLEVQGSFYASTADYVRLGSDGRFAATEPNTTLLSSVPPSAFGFLTDNPAPISVESGFFSPPNANAPTGAVEGGLLVGADRTLALVGGDFVIHGGVLRAPGGRLQLASVGSPGEVMVTESGLDRAPIEQAGVIGILDASLLDAGGVGAGQIFIRAGRLVVANQSRIQTDTSGNRPGIGIDIWADHVEVTSSRIRSLTRGPGTSGTVKVRAKTINLIGSVIDTQSRCDGNAACGHALDVLIEADKIHLVDGGVIVSATFTDGNTGKVIVKAAEKLLISGFQSNITAQNLSRGGGGGGAVEIEASQLDVRAGFIGTTSQGCSIGPCGDAGSIRLVGNEIRLLEGGVISATTFDGGDGGAVVVNAKKSLSIEGHVVGSPLDISGIYSNTQVVGEQASIHGKGGDIAISTAQLVMQGGAISAESRCPGCGDAGNITIHADSLRLYGEEISTLSEQAGGGNISIESNKGLVTLVNSNIRSSVRSGDEDAGNILIKVPAVLTLVEQSRIEANTFGGKGGFIDIQADSVLQSRDSVITAEATAKTGIDGEVNVESPDVDVTAGLQTLPAVFLDATAILPTPCGERSQADVIRLVARPYERLPSSASALRVYLPNMPTTPETLQRDSEATGGPIPQRPKRPPSPCIEES